MIDLAAAIPTLTNRLKTLPIGHFVEILTFKKDRSLKIVKTGDNDLLIIQNGFDQACHAIRPDKLKKTLKTLLKKEFPRSNKAHLHTGEYHQ